MQICINYCEIIFQSLRTLKLCETKSLVDIQGGDLLYQIFTSNILQRKAGEEAPFLEFIQRVCSEGRKERRWLV